MVRSFSSLVLALALAPATLGCAAAPGTAHADGARDSAAASAPTIGVFTSDASGFDTHSFYYDTGREVVVFDAQFTPALAEQAIAEIRRNTSNPIAWVVVTHPNPDKFNGASAFQAIGARVVASEATAAAMNGVHAYKKNYFVNVAHMFTDATYPAEAHVDVTFTGQMDLPVAGAPVHLVDLGKPGVSSTQTIALVGCEGQPRAMIVGDLVHGRTHAWLEGGIVDGKPVPTLDSWRAILEDLGTMGPATVYGGRGQPLSLEIAASEQRAYLDGMEALVRAYVDNLRAAGSTGELFDARLSDHAKAIAAEAAAAFPDDALAYLVEYGVYGLAQRLASP
jgi:glyoxylase-like metal-dependent hydrolase (beta-lactamase superfamily II)